MPRLDAKQRTALINAFERDVAALARAGWLTAVQAATLDRIANAL